MKTLVGEYYKIKLPTYFTPEEDTVLLNRIHNRFYMTIKGVIVEITEEAFNKLTENKFI